ncbi:hypothetical protein ABBQ32_013306 [Trebouxia sp. C0010 RCD-2024]
MQGRGRHFKARKQMAPIRQCQGHKPAPAYEEEGKDGTRPYAHTAKEAIPGLEEGGSGFSNRASGWWWRNAATCRTAEVAAGNPGIPLIAVHCPAIMPAVQQARS